MTMRTRTEEFGTYEAIQHIQAMEDLGWAVRQIVPLMESSTVHHVDGPMSGFTTKIVVVFEREDESGWVQQNDPMVHVPRGDEILQESNA